MLQVCSHTQATFCKSVRKHLTSKPGTQTMFCMSGRKHMTSIPAHILTKCPYKDTLRLASPPCQDTFYSPKTGNNFSHDTLKHCLLPKQRPNVAPPTPSMACLLPMQRPTSGHSGASGAAAAAAEAGVAAGAMFCAAAARCRHPEGSSCCAFLPLLLSSWTCAVLGTNNSMVSSSTHTGSRCGLQGTTHTQDPDAITRRLSQRASNNSATICKD